MLRKGTKRAAPGGFALLAGRWQAVLAILAIVAAGLAFLRTRPPRREIPFEAVRADLAALIEAGAYYDAADAVGNLLKMEPPLPLAQRAELNNLLAEIIYRQECLRPAPNAANVRKLREAHQTAILLGRPASAAETLRVAQAHEWLGQRRSAIATYRNVLEREPEADTRRRAMQALVRLLAGEPEQAEERRRWLEQLLADDGVTDAYLWWALQQALNDALGSGRPDHARELLTQHAQRFERRDRRGYRDYLWAWVQVEEGLLEQAELQLDRVDQWLKTEAPGDMALERAGFLPALTCWLRGRMYLAQARPQAALEQFDQALALHADHDTLLAASIGRVQALAMLERHERAQQALRDAARELAGKGLAGFAALRPRLRQTALHLFEQMHARGDFDHAISYMIVALELAPDDEIAQRQRLHERIALDYVAAADAAPETEASRARHVEAAGHFEQAAKLVELDEDRRATLLWQGAQEYDRGGALSDARRLLLEFADRRRDDPRAPQAWLQLGQSYAAHGDYEQALTWFQRLVNRHPELQEAARARLLTADALLALGDARESEAEALLLALLEDGQIEPQAQIYRDALLMLCDLYYQRGRYGDAIGRLENFLAFFPDDDERQRARFVLADAYRRSGEMLRDAAASGGGPQVAEEGRWRLRRAAELFAAFGAAGHSQPDSRAHLYERLALFYRGDCLYALGDPASLEEALATYRQAAARYPDSPAALTAQVQMANIFLRQGKRTEAAWTLERARWVLSGIPDSAFEPSADGRGREHWKRFLAAVGASDLFSEVLAGSP